MWRISRVELPAMLHIKLWHSRQSGISRAGCTCVDRQKQMHVFNEKYVGVKNSNMQTPTADMVSLAVSLIHGRAVKRPGERQWMVGCLGWVPLVKEDLRPWIWKQSMVNKLRVNIAVLRLSMFLYLFLTLTELSAILWKKMWELYIYIYEDQQLLEGPMEVLLCERVNDLRRSLFHVLNCLIKTASELRE